MTSCPYISRSHYTSWIYFGRTFELHAIHRRAFKNTDNGRQGGRNLKDVEGSTGRCLCMYVRKEGGAGKRSWKPDLLKGPEGFWRADPRWLQNREAHSELNSSYVSHKAKKKGMVASAGRQRRWWWRKQPRIRIEGTGHGDKRGGWEGM